jgi:hypothetical protein
MYHCWEQDLMNCGKFDEWDEYCSKENLLDAHMFTAANKAFGDWIPEGTQ